MEKIRLTASEEMSFKNVDGRTDDGRRMPLYTISSPMSLRLRLAKKVYCCKLFLQYIYLWEFLTLQAALQTDMGVYNHFKIEKNEGIIAFSLNHTKLWHLVSKQLEYEHILWNNFISYSFL